MTILADLKRRLAALPDFEAQYREAEAEFAAIEAAIIARNDAKRSPTELSARQS